MNSTAPSTITECATVEDLRTLQNDPWGKLRHHSTVEEYHDAMVRKQDNVASEHIDDGREPYLISTFAVEFGMHPFISINDMLIRKDEAGNIGFDIGHRIIYVAPGTLLAWRG